MKKKALITAMAFILALSAVSCGSDDNESSVSVDFGDSDKKITTQIEETEDSTTTSAEETPETTTVSDTETATTETETAVEPETSAETETAVPEETTPEVETPAQPESPAENSQPENNNQEQPPAPEQPAETPTQPAEEQVKFNIDNLLNDASSILSKLGTPQYSGQSPACTSNGNDVKIYQYDGLEIQCYIDGSTEYLFSVEIKNSNYSTDKNITVGSSRSDVESAYGTGEESGNYTIYYSGDKEMDIQYENDTVISVFFYVAV